MFRVFWYTNVSTLEYLPALMKTMYCSREKIYFIYSFFKSSLEHIFPLLIDRVDRRNINVREIH